VSLFSEIAEAYRQTKKPHDLLWNRFVARPLAAVLLVPLSKTRCTPNQITFASLGVFMLAAGLMVALPGYAGLLVTVAVIELSYVLDCVDGQLARMRKTSSPVGAHLDFLMDELKAFLLVAAVGARLWRDQGRVEWLIEALAGLVVVASAISLTTFVRRPEYLQVTGAPRPRTAGDYGDGLYQETAPAAPRSLVSRAFGLVETFARFLIHYPSYIIFVAAFDRLDLFLHVYLALNAAYAARTMLAMLRKLGRSA
jgi:phosphatidylglycerophosphate synthase